MERTVTVRILGMVIVVALMVALATAAAYGTLRTAAVTAGRCGIEIGGDERALSGRDARERSRLSD